MIASRKLGTVGTACGLILVLTALLAGPVLARNARLELPPSGLERPYGTPIFVLGHLGLGFGGEIDGVRPGAGASFVMRPGNAERFLPILQDWNTSLVLQAEYHRFNDAQRILSGDALFRHYLGDVDLDQHGPVFFAGPGVGVSEVELPGGGFEKGWEWLAELGQEWRPRRDRLLFWQLQYRWYDVHGHDFSHWAVKVGAGVPWPF